MKGSLADVLLFVIGPYMAVAVFVIETLRRTRQQPFTVTSLSSQFLEDERHFWGSVPFHFGLFAVLALHVGAFLLPGRLLAFNAVPVRVFALEATGLCAALLTAGGLGVLISRRASSAALRVVTSRADWFLLVLIMAQLLLGMHIAGARTWGSSWFAAALTPYLRSLFLLSPDIAAMAAMPWDVKAHVAGAFLLVGLIPFTRLLHALDFPLPYLWRRPQVVRWSRPRGTS